MKKVRVAIIRCGARKSPEEGEIPAHKRYQGQLFKTLKNGLQNRGFFSKIETKVFILSAEFGLIPMESHSPNCLVDI